MSALFACEVGQRFGVDGLIEEREAGRAEKAVALRVHFSHQHEVLAWKREKVYENTPNRGAGLLTSKCCFKMYGTVPIQLLISIPK